MYFLLISRWSGGKKLDFLVWFLFFWVYNPGWPWTLASSSHPLCANMPGQPFSFSFLCLFIFFICLIVDSFRSGPSMNEILMEFIPSVADRILVYHSKHRLYLCCFFFFKDNLYSNRICCGILIAKWMSGHLLFV